VCTILRLSRVVEERYITEHVTKKGAEDSAYDHRGYDHKSEHNDDWENNIYSIKKGREVAVKHLERDRNKFKRRPQRPFPHFRQNHQRPPPPPFGNFKRPRYVQQFHGGPPPFPGRSPPPQHSHRQPYRPHPNLPHHHHSNEQEVFPIPWQWRGGNNNRRQRGHAEGNFPQRQRRERNLVCNKRNGRCREWWRRRRRRRYNKTYRKRQDDVKRSDGVKGEGDGAGDTTMKRRTWMTKVKTNRMFW
jgi:hypothetical protein